ncbi:MAG: hypothetical protein ACTSRZ_09605 [Promethearchaeota archaeon]
MSKKPILSIIENIKSPLNEKELTQKLEDKDFWEKIIPTKEKLVKKKAPNVLFIIINEEFQFDPVGITKLSLKIEGELLFERKGADMKGEIVDFYIRNNTHLDELDGRIRIRKNREMLKIGVFIYSLRVKNIDLNIGQQAIEFVLRTKIREMLKNIEKL